MREEKCSETDKNVFLQDVYLQQTEVRIIPLLN